VLAHARPYWEPIVHEFREWHPHPQHHPRRWTLDEFVEFKAPAQQAEARYRLEHDFHREIGGIGEIGEIGGLGAIVERRRCDIGIAGRRSSAGADCRRHDHRASGRESSGSQAL
jgi:hypothetical protein